MTAKPWSDLENAAVAALWVAMAVAQYKGEKFVKARGVAEVVKASGRGRCSVEAKLMNLSAAAVKLAATPWLPEGYVKGYKPAPNYQKAIEAHLLAALAQSYDVACIMYGEPLQA